MIVPEKVLEILMIKYFREGGRKKLITDSDYNDFSEAVASKTNTVPASCNTWKRVFRHLTKNGEPHNTGANTCQTIAEYLQCESWEELMENLDEVYEIQKRRGGINEVSEIFTPNPTDNMILSLQKGDIIEVRYYPNRIVQMEFIKEGCYKVISSKNSVLQQGDIAYINLFVINQPLIIPQLVREGKTGRYQSAKGHNIQSVECVSRRTQFDI